jgi:hypothetical protein
MALTVETGTIIPGADSYVGLTNARAIAAALGLTLPVADADAEVALRKGRLYVDGYEGQFSGQRVSQTQPLAWPRQFATLHGYYWPSDTIPPALIDAQIMAASAIAGGADPWAVDDGKAVASEAVEGAVSISYHYNGKTGSSVRLTQADQALQPLLAKGYGGFSVGRGGY